MKSEDENLKQQKAGNPLFIIIIFAVLIAFLFYVPDIYKKYNSEITKFFGGGNSDGETGGANNDKSPISAYYQLGSKSTLKFNEITLSNIELSSNRKELKLTVNTEDKVDLDELEYYLEFYENRTTFMGRRVLHGRITKNQTLTIDVSALNITTTTFMVVSHIAESSIKPLDAESDESGLSSITCSKLGESYEYEFYLKKLTKTTYKQNYSESDFDKYASALLEAQKKEEAYNEYNGVTARIIESTNAYVFVSEFDYSKASSFQKLGDPRVFDKGMLNNVVKFKMDSEGFECK